MWRGLWLAVLHDHSIVAPSALTQSCDLAIASSPSPLRAGLFLPNADLIPWNIVNFDVLTVGDQRPFVGDHTQ